MDFKKFGPIALVKGLSDDQKKNILTGIAMGSIPVTAVLSGIAAVKLDAKLKEYKEREKAGEDIPVKTKVLELGLILFPPVATMTAGEIAIHGINSFNAAEVAALTALVAQGKRREAIEDKKLREELGDEKAKEIKDSVEKEYAAAVYDPVNDPMQLIIDEVTGREWYGSCNQILLAFEKAKVGKLAEIGWCDSPEDVQLSVAELYEYICDEFNGDVAKPLNKKFINIGWQGKDAIQYLHVEFEPGSSADGRRAGWVMTYSEEPEELKVIM